MSVLVSIENCQASEVGIEFYVRFLFPVHDLFIFNRRHAHLNDATVN